MIRPATSADAAAIARIVNEAFEVEREFRPGDRTNAAEIAKLIARDAFLVSWYERRGYRVTSVEGSNDPAFNRPLRIVQMEKPLNGADGGGPSQ